MNRYHFKKSIFLKYKIAVFCKKKNSQPIIFVGNFVVSFAKFVMPFNYVLYQNLNFNRVI